MVLNSYLNTAGAVWDSKGGPYCVAQGKRKEGKEEAEVAFYKEFAPTV